MAEEPKKKSAGGMDELKTFASEWRKYKLAAIEAGDTDSVFVTTPSIGEYKGKEWELESGESGRGRGGVDGFMNSRKSHWTAKNDAQALWDIVEADDANLEAANEEAGRQQKKYGKVDPDTAQFVKDFEKQLGMSGDKWYTAKGDADDARGVREMGLEGVARGESYINRNGEIVKRGPGYEDFRKGHHDKMTAVTPEERASSDILRGGAGGGSVLGSIPFQSSVGQSKRTAHKQLGLSDDEYATISEMGKAAGLDDFGGRYEYALGRDDVFGDEPDPLYTDPSKKAVGGLSRGYHSKYDEYLDPARAKGAFDREQDEAWSSENVSKTLDDLRAKTDKATGLRPDGNKKGAGFLGELKNSDGSVSTEYSTQSDAVKVDGKRVDFPTLVPTLTKAEIKLMTEDIIPNKKDIPEAIMQKAIKHANERKRLGYDVFFSSDEVIK